MTVTAQERGKNTAPEALENTAMPAYVKGYRAMSGSTLELQIALWVDKGLIRHLRDCAMILFSTVIKIHIVPIPFKIRI